MQSTWHTGVGNVKATFHSTIFDIQMRPVREHQRSKKSTLKADVDPPNKSAKEMNMYNSWSKDI